MQSKSDAQLLRDYTERGLEAAFAEIVRRHTNLVYSAALRLVTSPDSAPEIAQNVFVGLARGAQTLSAQLPAEASLAGWLCRSTRNQALKLWRDDSRRHSRERQAMELLDPISETAPDWASLRPVLDEAMAELTESDYDALVLRFFNNQDLKEVGRALGVSDDTAQKRVARALDKLRENLTRRGVATTGAALSLAISANAVSVAPAGLAATIATAAALAGTTLATTVTATAIKTIAMTTLQKSVITAALAAAVGTGIYEARQASRLREENQSFGQQISQLQADIENLSTIAAQAKKPASLPSDQFNELLRLRGEVGLLRRQTNELGRFWQEYQKLLSQVAATPELTNQ
ncbi:MAG: sigma-70 family RNA polymerase sigma factor, partial [Verrucomicrobia subdivision 3 bacterium]|nr:sigma-70 family RNA polymerase sigma factor [Limisphaerales bacterium]